MKEKRARLLRLMLKVAEAEFAIACAALGLGPIPEEAAVGRERRFRRAIKILSNQEVEQLHARTDAEVEEWFRVQTRIAVAQDLPS